MDAEVDVTRAVKTVHNVAAYLPGETDEYVIIGAHYDHLGLGGQYSLAPSQTGTIHPGADDNASGTAGVVELARYFSKQPKQKRGILFLNFAGEELGLLGSAYYVDHPLLPLDKAAAMINMDMIGRYARQGLHRRQRQRHHAAPHAGKDAAEVRDEGGLFSGVQRRIERPHLLHRQTGAGTVFLQRPAR